MPVILPPSSWILSNFKLRLLRKPFDELNGIIGIVRIDLAKYRKKLKKNLLIH